MNFAMTCEMAEMEDITVHQVIVNDDVANAKLEEAEKRRSVVGLVYMMMSAGQRPKKAPHLMR